MILLITHTAHTAGPWLWSSPKNQFVLFWLQYTLFISIPYISICIFVISIPFMVPPYKKANLRHKFTHSHKNTCFSLSHIHMLITNVR